MANNGTQCTYCGEKYKKSDYPMCPYCGGDCNGGHTPRVWKPTKQQKKAFSKKINPQNN